MFQYLRLFGEMRRSLSAGETTGLQASSAGALRQTYFLPNSFIVSSPSAAAPRLHSHLRAVWALAAARAQSPREPLPQYLGKRSLRHSDAFYYITRQKKHNVFFSSLFLISPLNFRQHYKDIQIIGQRGSRFPFQQYKKQTAASLGNKISK